MACAIVGMAAGSAWAKGYPERPVTMIVPFNAGGAADATGRIVGEALSRELGANVVIENVGGAGGALGTTRVKTAEPNGYVIGHMGTLAAAVPLNPSLKYDPRTDFEYLGLISTSPNVVYVRKNHPAKTLQEFIAYAKGPNGAPSMGHGGIGAASHVTCVMLFKLAGVEPNLVPYKGFGQTVSDILAERIDGGCDLLASVASQARSGNLRILAVAADNRSPLMPDAPSSAEAGLPEFKTETWTGLFVAKGTPAPIVERLRTAIAKVLKDDGVRQKLAAIGAVVPPEGQQGGAYMADLVGKEVGSWSSILAGIKADE
jgi:tripartite-type tricarboxylate transporter receptor subunit TctC